jgi:hypothetical protein
MRPCPKIRPSAGQSATLTQKSAGQSVTLTKPPPASQTVTLPSCETPPPPVGELNGITMSPPATLASAQTEYPPKSLPFPTQTPSPAIPI